MVMIYSILPNSNIFNNNILDGIVVILDDLYFKEFIYFSSVVYII